MSRRSSVEKGARKKGHLEADEGVHEIAVVGSGNVVLPTGFSAPFSRSVLVATDRNLYVMKLGQIGFGSIKDISLKIPIGEAQVKSTGASIGVGRRGEDPQATFRVIPMQSPKKLVEYVTSRG